MELNIYQKGMIALTFVEIINKNDETLIKNYKQTVPNIFR